MMKKKLCSYSNTKGIGRKQLWNFKYKDLVFITDIDASKTLVWSTGHVIFIADDIIIDKVNDNWVLKIEITQIMLFQ